MKNRDNFSAEVIQTVKLQAAYICSNPGCRRLTVAPSLTADSKVQYIGKVAHISAASSTGPRYLSHISQTERKDISNAIFLCSNCAEQIDKNNGIDYSIILLHSWKEQHNKWVLENLNKNMDFTSVSITSNNQQGGIIANTIRTVNIASSTNRIDLKILHDQRIFKQSEGIFNNEVMCQLFNSLVDEAECNIDDVNRLCSILLFYEQAANSYLNPTIEIALQKFLSIASKLAKDINGRHFDMWPYNQSESNFKIQLRPEYLRDTPYRRSEPDDWEKWQELFEPLKKKTKATKKSYDIFRRAVKTQLFL